jgi:ParB family transcriptional regulator, chromosome partitioning protein
MTQPKKNQQPPRSKSVSSQPSENVTAIQYIHLPKKEQPRRYFAPDQMEQLITSIEAYGILEPLIVRPLTKGNYELVAGERRLRAAKAIGLTEVPIVVRNFTDEQAFEVSLLENLQRDDLNPIDETEGLLYLLCQVLTCEKDEVVSLLNRAANAKRRNVDLTDDEASRVKLVDELFRKVGRLNRESFRTNRLPLLNMPEDVLQILRQGELEYTKAKAIAKLTDEKQRESLMEDTISRNLSLVQIKQTIRELTETSIATPEGVSSQNIRIHLSELSKLKSNAWYDPKKQESLKKLLLELQHLLKG